MRTGLFCASLLCAFCTGISAAEFKIVENGNANAVILTNPSPTAEEFTAEKELSDYLKKISGAAVSRYATSILYADRMNPERVKIVLVTLENGRKILPADVVKKLEATDNPEAFCIRSAEIREGKFIYIAGRTSRGVMLGTYAFLEKYLGVRWFHAGEEGEYCPKNKGIVLHDMDDFRQPWLRKRFLNEWRESVKPFALDDFHRWMTRNGFHWRENYNLGNFSRETSDFSATGGCLLKGGGHLTFELAVPKELFQTRPELFPLQNGKRICKERSQRCLANPEVQKRLADYIVDYKNYYNPEFRISFHDSTDGWCTCPDCVKMGTDSNGNFSYSNLAHVFCSQIADRVLKINPEAKLSYEIYSQFRPLPTIRNFKYDKRVIGEYCPHQRCYVHPLAEGECNAELYKLMLEWAKISPLGLFDYYAYSNTPYCPLEYTLAKDMKLYEKLHLEHFVEDCSNKELPVPHSNWPFYYVLSKLAWDTSIDVEKLLDEAYTLYYGAAAEPMKKYHAFRRELWESAPGHAMYGGGKRYGYCLTVPGAEKRLLGFLAEAEKLAGNDAVLKKRIAWDRKYLTEFWIAEAARINQQTSGTSAALPIRRLSGTIRIDGALDEDAWRSAPLISGFLDMKTKGEAAEETRVRVLYDDDCFYIGIDAMTEHAWGPLVTLAKTRDGAVWQDDSVEIFLVPPGKDYFHWIVNSAGVFYDAGIRNSSFDSKAEVKARVGKDRYTVEMRIPVKPLGVSKISEGELWKMHFTRECRNLQPPKTSAGSSIDGVPPHEESLFRKASLGTPVTKNGDFSEVLKVPENERKLIKSDEFPRYWKAYGGRLIKAGGRNHIELEDYLYTLLTLPGNSSPSRIAGTLVASGSGTLKVYLSGCIRKPGDKRGFGNELKPVLGEFVLTEKPSAYPLEYTAEPYSQYYLEFKVTGGKAVLESCVMTR